MEYHASLTHDTIPQQKKNTKVPLCRNSRRSRRWRWHAIYTCTDCSRDFRNAPAARNRILHRLRQTCCHIPGFRTNWNAISILIISFSRLSLLKQMWLTSLACCASSNPSRVQMPEPNFPGCKNSNESGWQNWNWVEREKRVWCN